MLEETNINILEESARIDPKVKPLSELNSRDYDGLLIPGGFGITCNLTNYEESGNEFIVQDDISTII